MSRTGRPSVLAFAPAHDDAEVAGRAFDSAGIGSNQAPSWPTDPVEVLRILYPTLLATARHLSPAGPRDDRDLVQDAIVEVLVRHPNFEGVEHPLGYARTVLFRLAYAGRRRVAREVPLEVLELMERSGPSGDHQDEVARRIVIQGALDSLGRRQRACLHLRFIEGMGTDEIAAVLGCSESTVRSQTARGLRRMRATLDEPADGAEEPVGRTAGDKDGF